MSPRPYHCPFSTLFVFNVLASCTQTNHVVSMRFGSINTNTPFFEEHPLFSIFGMTFLVKWLGCKCINWKQTLFLSKQEKCMQQKILSCIPDTGSSSHTWCDTNGRLLSSLYHHLHCPACSPNSLWYSHDYEWARGNNFANYSACGRDTGSSLHIGCGWICSKGFQNKNLLTPKHSETEMVESGWERSKVYSGIIKTHDNVKPFPNASPVVASIHGH